MTVEAGEVGMAEEVVKSEPVTEGVAGVPFGEEVTLITDQDLSEEVYGSYQGYKFNCPFCKVPSIMVNDDMVIKGIGICLKCHRKMLISSKTIEHNRRLRSSATKV